MFYYIVVLVLRSVHSYLGPSRQKSPFLYQLSVLICGSTTIIATYSHKSWPNTFSDAHVQHRWCRFHLTIQHLLHLNRWAHNRSHRRCRHHLQVFTISCMVCGVYKRKIRPSRSWDRRKWKSLASILRKQASYKIKCWFLKTVVSSLLVTWSALLVSPWKSSFLL